MESNYNWFSTARIMEKITVGGAANRPVEYGRPLDAQSFRVYALSVKKNSPNLI